MNRAASEALFEEQTRNMIGSVLDSRGWRVITRAYPVLDVAFERQGRATMRVQMHCDDWNELPPAIALLDADGNYLTKSPAGSGVFNVGPHPTTGRPFICMAGAREYHTHSSHTSDHWENYKTRSGYDLGGILHQVWSGWLKCTR
jgi:hypothetical protein